MRRTSSERPVKITDIAADNPVPENNPPAAAAKDPLPKVIKTGRNLPVAIGVGVVLGGLALLTLLTVKATFLIYMGVALAIGLHELAAALKTKDINVPLVPVALGGAAMVTAAYWAAGGAVLAAFALTVLAILIVPHVRRHRRLREGRHRRACSPPRTWGCSARPSPPCSRRPTAASAS